MLSLLHQLAIDFALLFCIYFMLSSFTYPYYIRLLPLSCNRPSPTMFEIDLSNLALTLHPFLYTAVPYPFIYPFLNHPQYCAMFSFPIIYKMPFPSGLSLCQ